MLATLIASSAQAIEENMLAAAVAAVLCRNFLRLTFIAVALPRLPMDHETRYFFRTDAPIVYFGSTMLPSRMRPAWLSSM